MNISGLIKFSLIDYPGKMSAVVFTQGCNFRCPYCHNPELIKIKKGSIPEKTVFSFLKSRIGKLEGVVITGGEPTLQKDLVKFIKKIKLLGFKIKLDTNGSNDDILKNLIKEKLVDYIAMDVKFPIDKYQRFVILNSSHPVISRSSDIYQVKLRDEKSHFSKSNKISRLPKSGMARDDKYVQNKRFVIASDGEAISSDVSRRSEAIDNIKRSINLIINSNIKRTYAKKCRSHFNVEKQTKVWTTLRKPYIKYEFRTTVVKGDLNQKDIIEIAKTIKGARLYVLQKFKKSKHLNKSYKNAQTYSDAEFQSIKKKIGKYVKEVRIR